MYERDADLLQKLRYLYRDPGDTIKLGVRSQLPNGYAKYVLVDTATGKVLAKHPDRPQLEATVETWKRFGITAKVYMGVGHGVNWREGETWQDFRRRVREYDAKRRSTARFE